MVPSVQNAERYEITTEHVPMPTLEEQGVGGKKRSWLFGNNPPGVSKPNVGGRPPSHVRRALLESFDARIHIFNDIVDGKPIERILHWCANCHQVTRGFRSASIGEMAKVLEILAKYSMGTTTTLTDKDGNNLPMAGGYDFSKLDQDEMDHLERLLAKARLR